MHIERTINSFVVNMGPNPSLKEMDDMQNYLNDIASKLQTDAEKLAIVRCVTVACAQDMLYLRTRNRWTKELEDQLIQLHLEGTPPNMFEYGVTKETQENLLATAEANLYSVKSNVVNIHHGV